MNSPAQNSSSVPLFEPDMEAHYTLEVVAQLSGVASETILRYHEQGLIHVHPHSPSHETTFDDEALRTLRRIDHLRTQHQLQERSLKFVLNLMSEVERLRAELRRRR